MKFIFWTLCGLKKHMIKLIVVCKKIHYKIFKKFAAILYICFTYNIDLQLESSNPKGVKYNANYVYLTPFGYELSNWSYAKLLGVQRLKWGFCLLFLRHFTYILLRSYLPLICFSHHANLILLMIAMTVSLFTIRP